MPAQPWDTAGNAVTGGEFLGTNNNAPLVIKTADTEKVRIDPTGRIGIGTPNPQHSLHLAAGNGLRIEGGIGVTGFSFGGNGTFGVDAPGIPNGRFVVQDGGNVGIGTSAPSSTLHVAGDVTVTGDVLLTGADCAEHFEVIGPHLPEPGTVLIIDEVGRLRECRDAYDKKVAGVVSNAGDYRHALVLGKKPSGSQHVALALIGKVYCKVDARHSPIEVGDLLTTSATPGHAMKVTEPLKAFGCVIGKALMACGEGQGLIPILIALQ
jgi:hypothetical protein